MPKRYQAKYYAQPRPGKGHRWKNTRTGEIVKCGWIDWFVDYLDENGKRRRLKAHTGRCTCPQRQRGVCTHEQMAIDLLAEIRTGREIAVQEEHDETDDPGVTVETFIASELLQLESSRAHTSGTQTNKKKSFTEFRDFCRKRGVVTLSEIDRSLVEQFRDDLSTRRIEKTNRPWKANNVNRYLRDVRAVLNKAVRHELINANPAKSTGRGDDLFLRPTDAKEITILSDSEMRTLLALSEDDIEEQFRTNARAVLDMVRIFYMCGLRLGELCNLTFAQIRHGAIHIEPHDGWIPKWGIRRSVPMTQEVREIIERRRTIGVGNAKYVFVTSTETRFGERNVGRMISDLFDLYGIVGEAKTGVSTHSLRHTFCTTCLLNNVAPTVVMGWMGHKTLDITLNYWHKVPSKSDSMIQRVAFANTPGHVVVQ